MSTVALSASVFTAADGDTYVSSAQTFPTEVFLNDDYDADSDVIRIEATSTGRITVKDMYGHEIGEVPAESNGIAWKDASGAWHFNLMDALPAAFLAAAPAGGTGVAAGGYDTAGNRDLLIALVNAIRLQAVARGWFKAE